MKKLVITFLSTMLGLRSPAADRQSTNWPIVNGAGGMHYSALKQINKRNVKHLQRVWQFDSNDQFQGSEMECNPLVVNGVLYATTPRLRVIALDAATGKLLWDFDAHRGRPVREKQRNRGLTYWAGGDDRRLFVGIDQYLYAINTKTGQPVPQFGDNGRVDLHTGLGTMAQGLSVQATSPGVVYKDLLILGSLVAEDLPAAPGYIRAFDVRTGQLRWTFHTIPLPGEFGYDTWPKDAYTRIGGANSWAGLTLDPENGMVFAPTGSASFDFYGANRAGDNLFANTLLALDAETGKRVWHFQLVRHDVLDRDLPAAPTLITIHRNGRKIEAIAQTTKYGRIWIFDRKTGKPLVPYETMQAPPTNVDGESLSPIQLLPTEPAPYARQQVTPDILTERTPASHAAVLAQFQRLRSGPQFTPPSREGTILFPGMDGGAEWGGSAWDPATGVLYVNSNEMAWIVRLIPRRLGSTEAVTGSTLYRQNCAGCHRPDRSGSPPEFPSLIGIAARLTHDEVRDMVLHGGGRMPSFARLGDGPVNAIVDFITLGKDVKLDGAEHQQSVAAISPLKYGIDGYNRWLDPDGYPAIQPPWGTLNAIDLNTNRYVWKIPFGEVPALAAQGVKDTGSENYGGGVVTAGGLFFIAATDHDHKIRAFDKSNGKVLWEATLPAAGNATPAVYEVNGREYLVIGAGGGKSGEASGGSYVAFALPHGNSRR